MHLTMHTLLQFDELLTGGDGRRYTARVRADEDELGHWRAWLEFEDADDSARVLRTGYETTQPNRRDTEYWATGLSRVYLDGALTRALDQRNGEPAGDATRRTPPEAHA